MKKQLLNLIVKVNLYIEKIFKFNVKRYHQQDINKNSHADEDSLEDKTKTPLIHKREVAVKKISELRKKIERPEPQKEVVLKPPKNIYKKILEENRISKHALMQVIKTNIFYLEELIMLFENEEKYRSYYKKVVDLKEQSSNCFKIVHRIRMDAPYRKSTMKAVIQHTRTVAKLLD